MAEGSRGSQYFLTALTSPFPAVPVPFFVLPVTLLPLISLMSSLPLDILRLILDHLYSDTRSSVAHRADALALSRVCKAGAWSEVGEEYLFREVELDER
ncbi:hypothetical protein JCM8547_008267 [Rhodosporidiobolus lusitaniae]